MAETEATLLDTLKNRAGNLASYAVVGSLTLYISGYLSLRFHLTVLGIGTDLTVLDDRYILTGVKFIVYLLPTVTSLLLICLVFAVILALISLPIWLLPNRIRTKVRDRFRDYQSRLKNRLASPVKLALAGIVLSLFFIQLVMRQCFNLDSLLISDQCPQPGWLISLLLNQNDIFIPLYFNGLVIATVLMLLLLIAAWRQNQSGLLIKTLLAVLAFLVAIQFLLLPVNYGVLVVDKKFPKVIDALGPEPIKDGQEAWLVWEGKEGMTYLIKSGPGATCEELKTAHRKLITIPKSEIKKTQIIGYDALLKVILNEVCSQCHQ